MLRGRKLQKMAILCAVITGATAQLMDIYAVAAAGRLILARLVVKFHPLVGLALAKTL